MGPPIKNTELKIPASLFWGVCGFCLLPFMLQLAGVDFSTQGPTPVWNSLPEMPSAVRNDALFYSLSGAFTHTIFEWSAFMAALFTVFLAFNHYSITRDVTTPVIGIALFCAGAMDAFHTLAADRLIEATAANTDLIPFTWAVARIFNAAIMLVGVSLFLVKRPEMSARQGVRLVLGMSALFGVIGFGIIQYCATSANLPQTQFPDAFITRPYDVVPLVMFLFAGLVVYPLFYKAHPSLFAHALILSAIPEVIVELHMAFGSTALFDSNFNAAHFLKIFAYLVPFLGLSLDYVRTYQKEQRYSAELQNAHQALNVKSEVLIKTITELEQTNRYKSDFLASMSHELRTPLNSILGFSEVLIRRSSAERSEKETGALKTIHRNGKHLLGLIDDILDLSKIDAGKMTFKKENLSVIELLDLLESQLISLVGDKDLALIIIRPEQDILFDSDEIKIMQILLNLGSNAIKYTESGQVTIAVRLQSESLSEEQLVISFKDTGIGISEANQNNLFSEFGRADDVKLKGIQGTGLGLLITKRLVELLGGSIELDSIHGQGSEFRIYLPGARLANVVAESGIWESDQFVVMAVDDDLDALEFLSMAFEDVGIMVISISDSRSVAELCQQSLPSVVCVDLQMPRKDGVDLIRDLKSLACLKNVPIVVVSGHMERYQEATEAGAESFLVKPCDQGMLISHIENVVLENIRSVLIVDCDHEFRAEVAEQLSRVRIKSFFASNSEAAIKKLEEFKPSAIIVDLANVESYGGDLVSVIATMEALKTLPVVLITSAESPAEYLQLRDRVSLLHPALLAEHGAILGLMKATSKSNRLNAQLGLQPLLEEYEQALEAEVETILVVEDTPDNMDLFDWILDSEELVHEGVVTGQAALDAVQKKHYQLILMDINLPDINGTEVTQQIRAMSNYAHTPIIAVTAHAIKSEIQGILDSGVTEIITKPIDQSELLAAINRYHTG